MQRENVFLEMNDTSLGDQICFLAAARIYARRHLEFCVSVQVLPEVVTAYRDDLLKVGREGRRIHVSAFGRHRIKQASPDKTYVGTYLAAIGEPVSDEVEFDPPDLPCPAGLEDATYIAVQPYSNFARNPHETDAFLQALVDTCKKIYADTPIHCIGRPNTPQRLKGVCYEHLGGPLDVLRLIQHATLVLTPRSASAHIAAGYRKPSLVWVCGDGEDWHLDYPHWPHVRISVDTPPSSASEQLATYCSGKPIACSGVA